MRHLVIGQRRKSHNFSAFHWPPHGCLITIGQHFVTTRVVHLPKRTKTSLITESDQSRANHSYCSYARSAQPGRIRTRLCGPCIAAKAGYCSFSLQIYLKRNVTITKNMMDFSRFKQSFTTTRSTLLIPVRHISDLYPPIWQLQHRLRTCWSVACVGNKS